MSQRNHGLTFELVCHLQLYCSASYHPRKRELQQGGRWRGFLLPRPQARFDGEKHVWVLGLLSFLAEPQTVTLFVALMPWLVVFIVQKKLGKERFSG